MKDKITRATDTFKEIGAIYLAIIIVASIVFCMAESRALGDSVWWAFVTAMTVGYGDIYPVTLIGRIVGVILMHIVPLFIAPLVVVRMMSNVIEDRDKFTNEEQEELLRFVRLSVNRE